MLGDLSTSGYRAIRLTYGSALGRERVRERCDVKAGESIAFQLAMMNDESDHDPSRNKLPVPVCLVLCLFGLFSLSACLCKTL